MQLNTGMHTPLPPSDCPGLIDLMLNLEELGSRFILSGVQCAVERVEDHIAFEAITPKFGLSVIYPGWYDGQYDALFQIAIIGDTQACLQWLPIDPATKRCIINQLPLNQIDKTIFTLAV